MKSNAQSKPCLDLNDITLGAGNFLFKLDNLEPDKIVVYTEKPIVLFDGSITSQFSLLKLKNISKAYAGWYLENGISKKNVVAIYIDSGVEFLIHYLALTSIGAIPAFVNGKLKNNIAQKYIASIEAKAIITDDTHINKLKNVNNITKYLFIIKHDEIFFNKDIHLPEWWPYAHEADDEVLITHTSGTTGFPKAVAAKHKQYFHCTYEFLKNLPPYITNPCYTGISKVLSGFPTSHNVSIAYCMRMICAGIPIFLAVNNKAKNILHIIETFKPSAVTGFARLFVDLIRHGLSKYNLSSVGCWRSTGDAMHQAHIKQLISYGYHFSDGKMQQGSCFFDGLGSSEMCGVFYTIHNAHTNIPLRCIGKPVPWVKAVILDNNGKLLGPDKIGLLAVKGASIFEGYWNDNATYEKTIFSNYFMPGDIAYYDRDGNFYQLDRTADVIKTPKGVFYTTQLEEILLKEFPILFECTIFKPKGRYSTIAIVTFQKKRTKNLKNFLKEINEILKKYSSLQIDKIYNMPYKKLKLGVTGKVLKKYYRENFSLKISI